MCNRVQGLGSLTPGTLALDGAFGFNVKPPILRCCGADDAGWDPDSFDLIVDGFDYGSIDGTDQCTGQPVDLTGDFTTWWSGNTAVATVETAQVNGVSTGSTEACTSGWVTEGNGSYCTVVPTEVCAPVYSGPYQIEPIDTASQGPADCTIKGQAGWVRNVTNQVQFADGSAYAVSGLTAADQISVTTPNQLGISGTQVGNYLTTGDGSFPDTYYVCSSACPGSGVSDAQQNWTVAASRLPHANALVYKCSSITIDGY